MQAELQTLRFDNKKEEGNVGIAGCRLRAQLPELLEMGVRRAGLRAPALGDARPTDPGHQQTGPQTCTTQQSLS